MRDGLRPFIKLVSIAFTSTIGGCVKLNDVRYNPSLPYFEEWFDDPGSMSSPSHKCLLYVAGRASVKLLICVSGFLHDLSPTTTLPKLIFSVHFTSYKSHLFQELSRCIFPFSQIFDWFFQPLTLLGHSMYLYLLLSWLLK